MLKQKCLILSKTENMVISNRALDEIVNFMASAPSAEAIIAFRPSEVTRQRVLDLLDREKDNELTDSEKSELDHYQILEHLFRLTKARARHNLAA